MSWPERRKDGRREKKGVARKEAVHRLCACAQNVICRKVKGAKSLINGSKVQRAASRLHLVGDMNAEPSIRSNVATKKRGKPHQHGPRRRHRTQKKCVGCGVFSPCVHSVLRICSCQEAQQASPARPAPSPPNTKTACCPPPPPVRAQRVACSARGSFQCRCFQRYKTRF